MDLAKLVLQESSTTLKNSPMANTVEIKYRELVNHYNLIQHRLYLLSRTLAGNYDFLMNINVTYANNVNKDLFNIQEKYEKNYKKILKTFKKLVLQTYQIFNTIKKELECMDKIETVKQNIIKSQKVTQTGKIQEWIILIKQDSEFVKHTNNLLMCHSQLNKELNDRQITANKLHRDVIYLLDLETVFLDGVHDLQKVYNVVSQQQELINNLRALRKGTEKLHSDVSHYEDKLENIVTDIKSHKKKYRKNLRINEEYNKSYVMGVDHKSLYERYLVASKAIDLTLKQISKEKQQLEELEANDIEDNDLYVFTSPDIVSLHNEKASIVDVMTTQANDLFRVKQDVQLDLKDNETILKVADGDVQLSNKLDPMTRLGLQRTLLAPQSGGAFMNGLLGFGASPAVATLPDVSQYVSTLRTQTRENIDWSNVLDKKLELELPEIKKEIEEAMSEVTKENKVIKGLLAKSGKERSNVNPIPFTVAFESDPSVKNHDVIREIELSMRPYVLRPKVYLVNAAKFNAIGGASKTSVNVRVLDFQTRPYNTKERLQFTRYLRNIMDKGVRRNMFKNLRNVRMKLHLDNMQRIIEGTPTVDDKETVGKIVEKVLKGEDVTKTYSPLTETGQLFQRVEPTPTIQKN